MLHDANSTVRHTVGCKVWLTGLLTSKYVLLDAELLRDVSDYSMR